MFCWYNVPMNTYTYNFQTNKRKRGRAEARGCRSKAHLENDI